MSKIFKKVKVFDQFVDLQRRESGCGLKTENKIYQQ
jgi:hypothetical protein